ncbi:mucin-2 isoform X3 [Folsomia candida]|uniref:mucin-2 isoform X3 n=1 Tax=Folsomia candida TaxID=158441 RepID=UPI000B90745C|nr:mucin-2 isoform X3 [Folsomia candida]
MRYAWNLLLFIWAAATIRLSSGACPVPTIGLLINDNWDIDTKLWSSELLSGTILDEMSFDIGEDGYDHMDAFRPEIERPDGATYELFFYPGPRFHDYVDLLPRNKSTLVTFRYNCDGADRTSQVIAQWDDINTRAPEFVPMDPSKLTYSINTNWDKRIPLDWEEPIKISDKDHDFANAQSLTFTSNPDILRFDPTHLYQEGDPIPAEYLTDVKVFVKDEYTLKVGDTTVQVTVSDGTHPASSPITITLRVSWSPDTKPVFTDTKYHHKMPIWPIADDPYVLDQPIEVSIPGDDTAEFDYTFSPVDYIRFEDPDNPRSIIFTSNGSPDDGNFVTVDITATKRGTELRSTVPLIIEFPAMPKPKFTSNEFPRNVGWNEEGVPQPITIDAATELNPLGEVSTFSIGSVYPPELSGNIVIEDRGDNAIYLTLTGITEEMEIKNRVAFVQVVAQLGEDQFERTAAVTVALYFPEKEDPTTQPTETTTACPTEVTTSCPICECSTTPAEGTTPCEPTTCPTEETCPTCPPPTTCPVTEDPGTTCPTTSETCPTCPPPTTCPVTEDPGTCPTCPPPTTCPVTEEPGTTCPSTSEPCPTCPSPTTCPVTTCPPTAPPTTPCPLECPTTTQCPERTTTNLDCPNCPDCEADSNTGLVAGIIVVSVLFAISLGGAGFLFWKLKNVATSSFPASFGGDPAPPKPRHSFAQPGSMRGGGDNILAEDEGWVNPAFSADPVSPNATADTLEQVLTHPAPSTSAAAFSPQPVTPYMTAPLVSDPPMKSSLAKPKEIAPDYEEGFGRSSENPDAAPKPKSGGVKIADEVEIINQDGESERL